MKTIDQAFVEWKAVKVYFNDDTHVTLAGCWLRDNCRCAECYNPRTKQRKIHILDVPDVDIIEAYCNNEKLIIKWSDSHVSTYDGDYLWEFDYETWNACRRSPTKIMWRGDAVANSVAKVPAKVFLGSDEGAKPVFQSLLDYGVAFIEGVEPTLPATEVICKALGGVQHTLFGGMWKISPEPGTDDTAYSNVRLPQHTDLSSFTEPAGLQVFHCLEHDGDGGESVISDGFYAATALKEEDPNSFAFLTLYDAEAEYKFDGHHFLYSAPIIELNKYNDLNIIRFNVFDRSAASFQQVLECEDYYKAIRTFAKIIERPDNIWKFKLQPGLVMVFDNFRTLHGRNAFTGMRVIAGSYVSRTDWLDRARSLGLIH